MINETGIKKCTNPNLINVHRKVNKQSINYNELHTQSTCKKMALKDIGSVYFSANYQKAHKTLSLNNGKTKVHFLGKSELNKIDNWNDKTILITGGTGSLAQSIVNNLNEKYNPKKIIILSNDENAQYEMKKDIKADNLKYIVGDIRDNGRLKQTFKDVDIVIHTAALKHVPICEENPEEAVKTNIIGTKNVIEAAIDNEVEKVLFISTDKAVAPNSLYCATKFIAEKYITDANNYSGEKTKFSSVRLGNILGSRGSVLPLFKKQKESGSLTITDEKMTRFWMTPNSSADFVISSVDKMQGGEIFLPKLKMLSVKELAKMVAPDSKINVIGRRPGENLHEHFINSEETRRTIELNDRFVILPSEKEKKNFPESRGIPEDFDYSSNKMKEKMTKEDLKDVLT